MTSPAPRPPSPERSAQLSAVIRSEISSSPSGRITFRRFMELALYHPELGYYRSPEDRPTRGGDFLTAPETHPIFGWVLARGLERGWAELDRPSPFVVHEYGAGSGTLGLSILDGLRRHGAGDLLDAIRYTPIETNPHRLDELASRFETAGLARRLALPAPGDGAGGTVGIGSEPAFGAILANEFLDALPVHRVVVRGGELREVYVTWREGGDRGGGLVQTIGEPSTPQLAERLAEEGISAADGREAEICLAIEPWLEEVAARVDRGFALLLDYGFEAAELYGPRHLAGTLLGYRGHEVVVDPLLDPGDVDLTAHVDFTAVRLAAERQGFVARPLVKQSEWLLAAGLEREWQSLRESDLTVAAYTTARSAVVRLLDPRRLGSFRVLELTR